MRVLFDTSTLVAALLEGHTMHETVFPWLKQVQSREIEGFIGAHSLAELFNKLTSVPMPRPVPTNEAQAMLVESIQKHFEIVDLDASDYFAVIADLTSLNLAGGIIYDALLLRAGVKANADRIFNLNPRHFQRIAPTLADRIVDPAAQPL